MAMQNLSVLISALENSRKTKEIEKQYKVSELTLNQQQSFLATAFDQFEKPVKTWNALNQVITECVEIINPNIKSFTVLERPYLIRELRDLTLGNKIIKTNDDDTKETYILNDISFKDFDKVVKEKEIKINDGISIQLHIPTLFRDNFINKQLLNQLDNIKRNASVNHKQISGGEVTVLYYHYEIIKFIKSITINGEIYDFSELVPGEQLRVVQSIDVNTSNIISEFIQNIKDFEQKAFTGITEDKTKTEVFLIDQTIFSKEV